MFQRKKRIKKAGIIYLRTEEEVKKRRFSSFIFLIFVILFLYIVFLSPAFKIKEIKVEGVDEKIASLMKDKIKQGLLTSFFQKNILFLNSQAVKDLVKDNFVLVKDLRVRKNYPDTLKLEIEGWSPKIIWQTQNKKYFIDSDGIAFEEALKESPGIPLVADTKNLPVNVGDKIVTKKFVDLASQIAKELPIRTGLRIMEIQVVDITSEVHVRTDQGWWIYFDASLSFENQVERLNLALNEIKKRGQYIREYINLTIPNKIFYK